jgi:hypothetical protein
MVALLLLLLLMLLLPWFLGMSMKAMTVLPHHHTHTKTVSSSMLTVAVAVHFDPVRLHRLCDSKNTTVLQLGHAAATAAAVGCHHVKGINGLGIWMLPHLQHKSNIASLSMVHNAC